MPQQINLESDASQRFQTTLGEQVVYIDLFWHDISSSWFITLEAADGSYIVKTRRMSTNTRVLKGVLTPGFEGDLVAVSLATPVQELARESWETTHKLTYYTEAELGDLPY